MIIETSNNSNIAKGILHIFINKFQTILVHFERRFKNTRQVTICGITNQWQHPNDSTHLLYQYIYTNCSCATFASATPKKEFNLQSLVRFRHGLLLLLLIIMLRDDIIYVFWLLLSIAIGPFYRAIETPRAKQWFATILGLALVICVSGPFVLHPLITILVNAVIITNLSWR